MTQPRHNQEGAAEQSSTEVASEEYARLSDQKAEDWRQISNVNPTLFGVAGAIFAAGVAERDAVILTLAPLPLFLGVFHMIRNAKLQMQMITYFAERAPRSAGRWESDISRLLPVVWRARESRGIQKRLGLVGRASAWNTWLAISLTTAVLVNVTSWLAGYDHALVALIVGSLIVAAATAFLIHQALGIEKYRAMWTAAWRADAAGEDEAAVQEAARKARYES